MKKVNLEQEIMNNFESNFINLSEERQLEIKGGKVSPTLVAAYAVGPVSIDIITKILKKLI